MFSVSAANLPENAEVIKALEYGNACGQVSMIDQDTKIKIELVRRSIFYALLGQN